ncbi:MAG: GNAT family N-acetyltransferase [Thermoleophilaceae bacterium]
MSRGVDAGGDLQVVRGGPERIADLQPLWAALQAHHAALAPLLVGLTARSIDESWARRRPRYDEWLAEPDAFVLIAERAGRPIGYALVRVVDGFHSFGPNERVGSVETLSVLPAARGAGAGTALMDAAERELARIGVRELKLAVVAGNDEALRFYARRGLNAVSHTLVGRIDDRPRAR